MIECVAHSRWIWSDDDPDLANVWVYARRSFQAPALANAWLNVTADLRYVAWINGELVGFGPPKSDMRTPTLDRYPIGRYLRDDRNVLTVLVYSLGDTEDVSSVMPRRGALLGAIETGDRIIVTDATWKVARDWGYRDCAIRRHDVQPHNEVFDDRLSLGEPWRRDYDDSDWAPATELSAGPVMPPYEILQPRDIALMPWSDRRPDRAIETGIATFDGPAREDDVSEVAGHIGGARRRPDGERRVVVDPYRGSVSANAAGLNAARGAYVIWDFGRVRTGYPVIEVRGDPGTIVDLSYGEDLVAGRVDPTKHLVYFDRLILADRPRRHRVMWPKCLRYMQADVRGGRADFRAVWLQESAYPLRWQGGFHCSDPVLDRAWEISANTLELCMEDSYMDTPWRERGSWLGDTMVTVPASLVAFGDARLARRFLRLHAMGQRPDGRMQGKYPGRCSSDIATWTLSFAILLADYVRYSGDEELGRELWPAAWRTVRWIEQYRTAEGVYGNLPCEVTARVNIYTFIDWAPVDTRGANAALNAFACACLAACSRLAELADDEEGLSFCRRRKQELTEAFRRLFWDPQRGVFVNGLLDGRRLERWGCHENVLAVLWDLADSDQRESIVARLSAKDLYQVFVPSDADHDELYASIAIATNRYRWDDRRMVPLGTPYFAYWAMRALCKLHRVPEALEMIRRHWGSFARQGATSTWEQWDMTGSLSHGWGAGPILILAESILGVTRSTTDPRLIRILPHRGNLTWARGRVAVPNGEVGVFWRWDGQWHLEVQVPEPYHAVLGLPESEAAALHVNGKAGNVLPTDADLPARRAVELAPGAWQVDTVP